MKVANKCREGRPTFLEEVKQRVCYPILFSSTDNLTDIIAASKVTFTFAFPLRERKSRRKQSLLLSPCVPPFSFLPSFKQIYLIRSSRTTKKVAQACHHLLSSKQAKKSLGLSLFRLIKTMDKRKPIIYFFQVQKHFSGSIVIEFCAVELREG